VLLVYLDCTICGEFVWALLCVVAFSNSTVCRVFIWTVECVVDLFGLYRVCCVFGAWTIYEDFLDSTVCFLFIWTYFVWSLCLPHRFD